ncbi:MAG: PQQ-binding-like beta-propeller repeat protein, partial [Planctomycetota bacterium]
GEGEGPYNGEIISSPVHANGIVYLQLWRDTSIRAIRLRDQGREPETMWVSRKPGPVESSVLAYRGLVYALMDNGVLVCLNGSTGEEVYRERLASAGNSSPVASDGRIYVSDNEGKTHVIQAGRSFKVLSVNPLGERISASPAISGDRMIYRTDSHVYCIGE